MNHSNMNAQPSLAMLDRSSRINQRNLSLERLDNVVFEEPKVLVSNGKASKVEGSSAPGNRTKGGTFKLQTAKCEESNKLAKSPNHQKQSPRSPLHQPPKKQSLIFEQLASLVNGESDEGDKLRADQGNGLVRGAMFKQDSTTSAMSLECHDSLILEELAKGLDEDSVNNDDDKSITLEDLRESSVSPPSSSTDTPNEFHEGCIFDAAHTEGLLSDIPSSRAISVECHDSLILEELAKELDYDADDDQDEKSTILEDLRESSVSPPNSSTHIPNEFHEGKNFDVVETEGLLSDVPSSRAISVEYHDSIIFEELAKELDEDAGNYHDSRSTINEDSRRSSSRSRPIISSLGAMSLGNLPKRRRATRGDAPHYYEATLSNPQPSSSAIAFECHDSFIFEEIAEVLEGNEDNDDESITLEDIRHDSAMTNLSAVSRFEQSVIEKQIRSGNIMFDGFNLSFRYSGSY